MSALPPRLTLEVGVHATDDRRWATVTAWGIDSGRYGSLVVGVISLAPDVELHDREELVDWLLRNLGSIAYG
uniref:Uncharacterized protein n=1 Tax=uncultured prokaryote TaxID=198431 RepID=A0A0H5Q5N1_9ZZZZ|nr:hypothetical protein [uncultured prokaryote]